MIKRESLIIAGAVVFFVAVSMGLFSQAAVTSEMPGASGFAIPSWLTTLLGSTGVITFIVGLLQKGGPTPDGQVDITEILKQVLGDGKLNQDDIKVALPLLLQYLKNAVLPKPGPTPEPDTQFPEATDVNKFITVFNQVLVLAATSEQVKGKGTPKYINATVVYDKDTVFPVVLGIDPRAASTPQPTPV